MLRRLLVVGLAWACFCVPALAHAGTVAIFYYPWYGTPAQDGDWQHWNQNNHRPIAPRKLLLHRQEIRKLQEFAKVKGNTVVPLSVYWKGNRVKVQLAVGKGKAEYDKREDIKKRESDRELKQVQMHAAKGR